MSPRVSPQDISVVVCAYTELRWNELLDAVASVKQQTVAPHEIIVVVDHNQRLLERARTTLSGVRLLENSEARGLGGARNSGVAAAQGSVVAFLDDDAIAAPDWLERLAAGYTDERIAGVGGAIEPMWRHGQPSWFPAEFNWVVGCTYRGMPQTRAAVRNLIGCNMSFRREVFGTIGTFRLGYGNDETELCIRLRQRCPDAVLMYEPAAKVSHQIPADRGRWAHFRSRCYFEGGSKAVVSWLLGAGDGLATERAYTARTLPSGVVREVFYTLRTRDTAGIARAATIVAGLGFTTAGYLVGRLTTAQAARRRGWVEHVPSKAV